MARRQSSTKTRNSAGKSKSPAVGNAEPSASRVEESARTKSTERPRSSRTIEKELIVRSESIDHEAIALRAWEIWQQEGAGTGNELKHWFQAEQELAGRKN